MGVIIFVFSVVSSLLFVFWLIRAIAAIEDGLSDLRRIRVVIERGEHVDADKKG